MKHTRGRPPLPDFVRKRLLTVKVSPDLRAWIVAEAERTGRSHGAIVEEAIRMLQSTDGPLYAVVEDRQEIVSLHRLRDDAESAASDSGREVGEILGYVGDDETIGADSIRVAIVPGWNVEIRI